MNGTREQDDDLTRLDALERRLSAAEAAIKETREVLNTCVLGLCQADEQQRKMIASIFKQLGCENDALLATVQDMQGMVEPAYDKAFPEFGQFKAQLAKVIGSPPG